MQPALESAYDISVILVGWYISGSSREMAVNFSLLFANHPVLDQQEFHVPVRIPCSVDRPLTGAAAS